MAQFFQAIEVVLANEGDLADDPSDIGGITRWGISHRSYPEVDIASLTRDQAMAIYLRDYWNVLYNQINSQAVATKLLDLAVNMGTSTAVRLLQEALGYLQSGPMVTDGIFGARTLQLLNDANEEKLLCELRARAAKRYLDIILADKSQEKFALGWIRRAVS